MYIPFIPKTINQQSILGMEDYHEKLYFSAVYEISA